MPKPLNQKKKKPAQKPERMEHLDLMVLGSVVSDDQLNWYLAHRDDPGEPEQDPEDNKQ
jgi:hypothetical protein